MLETKYQEFHLKIETPQTITLGKKVGTDRVIPQTKTLKDFLNG